MLLRLVHAFTSHSSETDEIIAMKFEQFTHASQELIQKAAALAQEKKNPLLTPLHLLAAALYDDFCRSFFFSLGIHLDQLNHCTTRACAIAKKRRHTTNH